MGVERILNACMESSRTPPREALCWQVPWNKRSKLCEELSVEKDQIDLQISESIKSKTVSFFSAPMKFLYLIIFIINTYLSIYLTNF